MTWGPWTLERDTNTLVCRAAEGYDYEINLKECNDAASTLDWIAQVAEKTWAAKDPAVIGHLVLALNALDGGLRSRIRRGAQTTSRQ